MDGLFLLLCSMWSSYVLIRWIMDSLRQKPASFIIWTQINALAQYPMPTNDDRKSDLSPSIVTYMLHTGMYFSQKTVKTRTKTG